MYRKIKKSEYSDSNKWNNINISDCVPTKLIFELFKKAPGKN
jgi:hypothetical protein